MLVTHSTPPTVPGIPPGQTTITSDYSYEKPVKLIGSPDGTLINYQVKLVIHRGTGTDDGRDVYLNGHSLSWPNDIRFVSATGTQYSYWIESSDPDTATVWVKIDDIPASPGDTEVKLMYGRAGDVGESDGASTFPFFDDFSSPYLDSSKWNSHPESASTYNGMLRVIGNNKGNVLSKSEFGPGYALESRVSITNTGDTDNFVGFCNSDLVTDPYTGAFNSWKSANWMYDGNYVNGDTGVPLSTGWTRLTSIRNADGTSVGRINLTGNYVGKVDSRQYSVCVHHYGNGATYVDWALVRKYTQYEPVIGKWSGETYILLPPVTPALSGYSHIKANTIQGSPDMALTDYQVKYTVHRGEGIDSSSDVYLNNGSQSWPSDIRFADASGVLYSYWMGSSDADSAVFWVKIGPIPAFPGSTHVLLSYGKPNDVSLSNGDGTFILFDDFNDNTLNGSKWVKVMGDASADAFVKDGMLELQSGNVQDVSRPFIRSADTYAGNYTIDVNAKYLGQNTVIVATNWDGTLAGQFRGPDNGYESFYNSWASGGPYWEIARDTGNQGVNLGQYSYDMDNQFHRISVIQKPDIALQVDGKTLLTGAIDTKYKNGYVGLGGREDQEGIQTFYDDFRMRQYTEHPPVQGAWTTLANPSAAGENTTSSRPTPQGSDLTNFIAVNSGIIILLALALVVLVMLAILALILAITVFKL